MDAKDERIEEIKAELSNEDLDDISGLQLAMELDALYEENLYKNAGADGTDTCDYPNCNCCDRKFAKFYCRINWLGFLLIARVPVLSKVIRKIYHKLRKWNMKRKFKRLGY